MGIFLSTEEVKGLEGFGNADTNLKDQILLAAGMAPTETDRDIKEFLKIDGPTAALIRGISTIIHEKSATNTKQECNITYTKEIERISNEARVTVTQIKLQAAQEVEHWRNQAQEYKETIAILQAEIGNKQILIQGEVGHMEEEEKLFTEKVEFDI